MWQIFELLAALLNPPAVRKSNQLRSQKTGLPIFNNTNGSIPKRPYLRVFSRDRNSLPWGLSRFRRLNSKHILVHVCWNERWWCFAGLCKAIQELVMQQISVCWGLFRTIAAVSGLWLPLGVFLARNWRLVIFHLHIRVATFGHLYVLKRYPLSMF